MCDLRLRIGRLGPGLAACLSLVVLLAGCRLPENALDGPLAVPLRISVTEEAIEVDAPTWYATETALYVCPAEPPPLPEPGPGRVGWTPDTACHDFGRVAAEDGLHALLPLDALTEAERVAFGAVDDWYLLVVKVEDDRVTAAIHSRFSAPVQPAG